MTVFVGHQRYRYDYYYTTPESLASEVCQDELQYAMTLKKRLVPLLRHPVGGRVPQVLADLSWILFRDIDDFEGALILLIRRQTPHSASGRARNNAT